MLPEVTPLPPKPNACTPSLFNVGSPKVEYSSRKSPLHPVEQDGSNFDQPVGTVLKSGLVVRLGLSKPPFWKGAAKAKVADNPTRKMHLNIGGSSGGVGRSGSESELASCFGMTALERSLRPELAEAA
jgi:hypothetical protein